MLEELIGRTVEVTLVDNSVRGIYELKGSITEVEGQLIHLAKLQFGGPPWKDCHRSNMIINTSSTRFVSMEPL